MWVSILVPSVFLLVSNRDNKADTWIDQFFVSGISVIMATFIAWIIWDRSRNVRSAQEEKAAQRVRLQLFLQAEGSLHDVMKFIQENLVGHFAPIDKAYKADVSEHDLSGKPTFRNRIATHKPEELSLRIQMFHRNVGPLMNQLNALRGLVYNSAVTLQLDKFLQDWDAFVRDFSHYVGNQLYVREHFPPEPNMEGDRDYIIGNTDLIYQEAVKLARILEGARAPNSMYR